MDCVCPGDSATTAVTKASPALDARIFPAAVAGVVVEGDIAVAAVSVAVVVVVVVADG